MYCLGASSIQCLAINSDNIGSSESDASFIMGDVNADGSFDVADVVLLQKWLLAIPDTHLVNWRAANYCDDECLNVFDLCLMKRVLIKEVNETLDNFALANKTFVYEKEGIGGLFTISFKEDGTYMYYEGDLSSYIGSGSWNIDGNTVVLSEEIRDSVIRLKIQGDTLIYIAEGSGNFYYIKVKDGERFTLS